MSAQAAHVHGARFKSGIVRSVLGILVGFGIFFAIVRMLSVFAGNVTDAAPGKHLLLSVTWTVAAAVLGGYIAARIAGEHEFPHAAAVGLAMIGMSFLSMRQEGIARPGWYQITIAGCGPISAMIGAAIRLLTKPSLSQPGLNQPGLNQPGLNQPGLNQPGLNQPGLTKKG